jgi:hypothetical protein
VSEIAKAYVPADVVAHSAAEAEPGALFKHACENTRLAVETTASNLKSTNWNKNSSADCNDADADEGVEDNDDDSDDDWLDNPLEMLCVKVVLLNNWPVPVSRDDDKG